MLGGDLDFYNSYAQRNPPTVEHVVSAGVSMIPSISRLRILRHWGGVMDMSMDGSPIIGKAPIDNLYLNCGWCYGGLGDAGLRLGLRPHHRRRRAPFAECRLVARSVRARLHRRRRRQGPWLGPPLGSDAMLIIPCPYCGPRDHSEFTYVGDAARTRPPLGAEAEAVHDWVHLRDNPRGPHLEFCSTMPGAVRSSRFYVIRQATASSPPVCRTIRLTPPRTVRRHDGSSTRTASISRSAYPRAV